MKQSITLVITEININVIQNSQSHLVTGFSPAEQFLGNMALDHQNIS
jgi:hypothetical protein